MIKEEMNQEEVLEEEIPKEKVYTEEELISEPVEDQDPREAADDQADEERASLDAMLWNALTVVGHNIDNMTEDQLTYLKVTVDEWYNNKSTPKQRLNHEITELSTRIDKLQDFLRKRNEDGILLTKAKGLPDAAVLLMHKQLDEMLELHDIMAARYSIFDMSVKD